MVNKIIKNNKGQIGGTLTWVFPTLIILLIFSTIYLTIALSKKAAIGGVDKELIFGKKSGDDTIITQNLINLFNTEKTNDKQILERICQYNSFSTITQYPDDLLGVASYDRKSINLKYLKDNNKIMFLSMGEKLKC